jgi:hypothetical protein
MQRSGFCNAEAMEAMDNDDVLDAMIVVSLT